jgi:hypothetical protein
MPASSPLAVARSSRQIAVTITFFYFSKSLFFGYCHAGWGYIVAFTKVPTIYHT